MFETRHFGAIFIFEKQVHTVLQGASVAVGKSRKVSGTVSLFVANLLGFEEVGAGRRPNTDVVSRQETQHPSRGGVFRCG